MDNGTPDLRSASAKPSAYRRVALTAVGCFLLASAAVVAFFLATTHTIDDLVDAWSRQRGDSLIVVLQRMRRTLALTTRDYAVWDATWDFIAAPDPAWADENLDWLVRSQGIAGVLVLDGDGGAVHENGVFASWPQESRRPALEHFTAALREQPTGEIMLYEPEAEALYWLAGSRVVRNEDEDLSGPHIGTLILARLVGPEDMAFLAEVTGVERLELIQDAQGTRIQDAQGTRIQDAQGTRILDAQGTRITGAAATGRSLVALPPYLGPPGLALAYDARTPLVERELQRWRLGTGLSVAAILAATLGLLLATNAVALRPFRALSGAVSRFAGGAGWQPPVAPYHEFQAIVDALSQAARQQQAAEQNERHRADELRLLLDNLPAYVFFKDRDSRYIAINRQLAELFGVPESAVPGKKDQDFFPPDVTQILLHNDRRVLSSGQRLDCEERLWIGGRHLITRTVKVPLRDRAGEVIGLVGLAFDITEQRRLEEALRQSQKLDAVGQLAGGVAHDFNNVLTSIMSGVELAILQAPPDGPLAAELEEVRQSAFRASQITRQLLFLSHNRSLEKQSLDLNQVVASLSKMLHRLLGEDVTLRLELTQPLPFIFADRTQVEQVLLNLVLNARDAMPGGGTVTIGTAVAAADSPPLPDASNGARGRPHVLLSVRDTGTGISPEVRHRLFDLFFTTKKDRGTGLGLSVVQSIVKDHQALIWFDSEEGTGSTFHIAWPTGDGEQADERRSSDQAPLPTGHETILVVEDDTAVRLLTERVLGKQGYRVFAAGGAEEAIALIESLEQPPALLLSDVVMPGMNGVELARLLQERQPSLKVVLISGYSDSAIAARGLAQEGYTIVSKPYTPASLAQAIRHALDG